MWRAVALAVAALSLVPVWTARVHVDGPGERDSQRIPVVVVDLDLASEPGVPQDGDPPIATEPAPIESGRWALLAPATSTAATAPPTLAALTVAPKTSPPRRA
jgi:hypothetical protein